MKNTKQIELTYDELFLLEMAVDDVLYGLNEDSETYKIYLKLDKLLYDNRVELGRVLKRIKRKEV